MVDAPEGKQGLPSVRIAKRLLDMGVLREDDWDGSFGTAINAGLTRWLNDEHGASKLRLLSQLGLWWTDDCERIERGINDNCWYSVFAPRLGGKEPIGLLALKVDTLEAGRNVTEVWPRRAVGQLNRISPGLGFGVLSLLDEALGITVDAQTFAWAYSQVYGNPEVAAGLTVEQFLRTIPMDACHGCYKLPAVKAAIAKLRAARSTAPREYLITLLESTIEMDRLVRRAVCEYPAFRQNEMFTVGRDIAAAPVTVVFRWSEKDEMPRLVDSYDYATSAVTSYSWGPQDDGLAWMHGFSLVWPGVRPDGRYISSMPFGRLNREPVKDGTLEAAIDCLGLAVDIMVAAERLCNLISERPPTGQGVSSMVGMLR